MTKLVLVTALYDLAKLDGHRHRTVDELLDHGWWVLTQRHDLVVFTEPGLYGKLDKRRVELGRDDTMTLNVTLPFRKLVTPERAVAIRAGRMQDNACPVKVTPNYIQLMWGKYTMLRKVIDEAKPDVTHVGWIDFGIRHVAKAPPIEVDVFAEPTTVPRVHRLRYFNKDDVQLPDYWRNVHGHLAGGLVVGEIGRMEALCEDFWHVADMAIAAGYSPLDEGLLSYIVSRHPEFFSFSHGDYCDILQNHDKIRGGHEHLEWQIADAKGRGIVHNVPGYTRPAREILADVAAIHAVPKPVLGLVMIVKNEAHGLRATLESVKPYIGCWTIVDTGSTDGTQDLIRATMGGVVGTLHERPFVDFSTTRNEALDIHRSFHPSVSSVFTLMLDADDVLVNGSLLLAALTATDKPLVDVPGFLVNIRRGELDYWLPLVLRVDAAARYRGRVHEYVDAPISARIDGVQVIQTRPAQSAEASRARWGRDLEILRAEVVANPKDPRAAFYPAQTYECLGESANALRTYDHHIAIGWPFDEVFEARFRRAKIMDTLKMPWAEVMTAYLDAYTFDSRHAEPLFMIAAHYYNIGNHALAFMFASRAATLPLPVSQLYLDHEICTFRAHFIAGISGFHMKDPFARQGGALHARSAVVARPGDEQARANWAFYAPTVRQAYGATTKEIDFHVAEPYVCNNPSVHYDPTDDRWRCLVRTTNYKIVDGQYITPDDNVIYTRNYLLELDHDLNITRALEVIDATGEKRSTYPVHGFEDCRLFRWRGELYCTATVCDFDLSNWAIGPREIVCMRLEVTNASGTEGQVRVKQATPIRGMWSDRAQKNWMPAVSAADAIASDDRGIRLVYSAAGPDGTPTVLEHRPTGITVGRGRSDQSWGHGRLRGGSQLIEIPGGQWLAVVHDVAWPGNGRMYLHRFAMFSHDLKTLEGLSEPFVFEKHGIEFCAGLALETRYEGGGSRLIASYGIDDKTANFAIFDLTVVLKSIRADFVI